MTWLAAAVSALLLIVPFQAQPTRESHEFSAEVSATSNHSGHIQIYFDSGAGFNEPESTTVPLVAQDGPVTYRLELPPGDFHNFRLDPIDRDGTVTVHSVRIVDRNGRLIRELPLGLFQGNEQVQSLRVVPDGLEMVVVPGKDDPQLALTLSPPLELHAPVNWISAAVLFSWAAVFGAIMLICAALEFSPNLRARLARRWTWLQLRPRRAIAAAGLFGVILSCYPVIFAGRSFVSPNYGSWLLYDQFPTLPGYTESRTPDVRGADIGALMWQQVPYSAIQHRSLLWDFELPLWNRDNAGGTPLLGQGQSMFGDPVHFLVIAANGAAWAWDLKFLIARWLLALGLGLCVWTLCRHRGAAMLVAAAAPFCGFFLYRINHPAVFSFCYAPWILYFWLRIAAALSWRPMALATAGLLLANWTELNSGTVKEAYVFLLTFNLVGAIVLFFTPAPISWRLRQSGALAGAGVLWVGLTTPIWYTFLDALRISSTGSDQPAAWQIQPSLLIGLFDEALFRPVNSDQFLFNPSANFLLLAGVLYFFATLREQMRNRASLGLLVGSAVPLALVFGLIPPDWIEQWPFIGQIHHIDDCFGSALILLTAILAGAGFATAEKRLRGADGLPDLGIAGILLGVLLWAYFGFGHAVHRALLGDFTHALTVWKAGTAMNYGSFVPGYLASLVIALVIGSMLARVALTRPNLSPALGIGLTVCVLALVWRGGVFTGPVRWPGYVLQAPPRANFRARSPAEKEIEKSARAVPIRSIGLQSNFFPGWTAMYGLECINGPDALANPSYRQLTQASALQRVWDWRLYLTRDNLAASRPFLDLLNVKHYLDLRSDQGALQAVLKLDQVSDLDLYESRTYWPRAFFVDRIAEYATAPDLMALIAADHNQPFAAVQAGEITDSSPLANLLGHADPSLYAPATAYHLTENSTSFLVHAATSGLVVLTETFWSGYPHAQIDGMSAHVIRTNHAFIGIPVAAGDHRITVRYRPRFFDLNLLIAAISALLLAGSFLAAWAAGTQNKLA